MTKDKLIKELDIYMMKIIKARNYFDLHKNMLILSHKKLNKANLIATYIDIVSESLAKSFINETYLLIDSRNDKNIFRFINVCKQNHNLFRKELTEDYVDCDTDNCISYHLSKVNILNELSDFEKELNCYSIQINNLLALRDKVYAHVDKKYYYDRNKISKKFRVCFQDIDDILNVVFKNMNHLSNLLSATIYYSNDAFTNDFKAILNSIK